MSYILPQVQVFQEFRVLPTAVISNLNAFVFGPNYQLYRYGVDSEKAFINVGKYNKDEDTSYAYPMQPAGSVVDQDYVKLYMENVWAEYHQIPASEANPLVVVGKNELNKLRAAPVIGEALAGMDSLTDIVDIGLESAGYFTGGVRLPEDYYFYPVGGADGGGAWSENGHAVNLDAGEDAKIRYVSTENLSGYIDILSNQNPLMAGNWIDGPDGIKLNLSEVNGPTFQAPRRLRFRSSGQEFTVAVNKNNVMPIIDWAVDQKKPLRVKVETGVSGGVSGVDWDPDENILEVTVADGESYDMADLYADLTGSGDQTFDVGGTPPFRSQLGATITPYFVFGDAPAGSEDLVEVLDQADNDIVNEGELIMMRDAYRIRVTPNPYTFAGGNKYNFSSHFNTRGVRVGDRVRYQFTDTGDELREAVTKVVGFEADEIMASISDPKPKETNAETQINSNIAAGGLQIVVPGSDNRRAFDNVNTRVHTLSTSNQKFPGDLSAGVIADNFRVAVTVTGPAGTARATVSNESGTYFRQNVLIEVDPDGAADGMLYLGNNLVIEFHQGNNDVDANFQVGDSYTFDTDVLAPFNAPDLNVMDSGGEYIGYADTTYIVEVVRGGVFNRNLTVVPGITHNDDTELSASINWAEWSGGDVYDEYILRCTVGGSLTEASFALTSQLGDNVPTVGFGGVNVPNVVGRGLSLQFDADPTGGFAVGDYWVVRVNAARPMVRITDSAGIDGTSNLVVPVNEVIAVGGFGATLTFYENLNNEGGFVTGGGLRKGDVYYVPCHAPRAGALKTLVLADDIDNHVVTGIVNGDTNPTPDMLSAWLYLVQLSTEISQRKEQLPPYFNFETSESEVDVKRHIAIQDTSWVDLNGNMPYLPVYHGDLYLEYRALLRTYSDTIHTMEDIADVETRLGTIHPDNPLAQGVYNAIANSGDRSVYYMAVPTADHAGFMRALDRASLNESVYGFAPLTQDRDVLTAVEAHINSMSTEENKRWRIGFFGTAMPTDVSVYDTTKHPSGEIYYATVEDDPRTSGADFSMVRFVTESGDPSTFTHALEDVRVGDKVRINFAQDPWGAVTYGEYTVSELMSNTMIKIDTSLAAPVTIPTKVEVWHDYSVQEMTEAMAAISSSFANRRIYHVFPSLLGAFGVQQTSEFAAAAVAGLCSSVPPQQGLTNIEINGFDDLPMVYSTLNRTQLNLLAGNGTMILMQDVAGGPVYIRHQVSTNTASGDLNQTELSVTKNLDSISYYFARRLAPFIGRYNITPEMLTVIRTQIDDGLFFLGAFTGIGLLGPQIILEGDPARGITGTSIERVEQHPTLMDHVVAVVNVRLPYPLNVIQLHLVV